MDVGPSSFETWYQENWSRLVTAVRLETKDIASAEDAVAEAVIQLMDRWNDGSISDPAAWAYRVATRRHRRLHRRLARDVRWTSNSQVHSDVLGDPVLWASVAELPRRQRTAVVLRYLFDLTQSGVAEEMGVAPGTVAALLSQARERLRSMEGVER